jgi:hypothetical protein
MSRFRTIVSTAGVKYVIAREVKGTIPTLDEPAELDPAFAAEIVGLLIPPPLSAVLAEGITAAVVAELSSSAARIPRP